MAKRITLDSSTKIMRFLAETYFDNMCFCTHEKFKDRGFVIHHLYYINNDVIRSDYPAGEKGRFEYLTDLVPMIKKNPDRLVLIKNGNHTRLDHVRRGLTRMKRENFLRLVLLVFMTKKEKFKPRKQFKPRKKFK